MKAQNIIIILSCLCLLLLACLVYVLSSAGDTPASHSDKELSHTESNPTQVAPQDIAYFLQKERDMILPSITAVYQRVIMNKQTGEMQKVFQRGEPQTLSIESQGILADSVFSKRGMESKNIFGIFTYGNTYYLLIKGEWQKIGNVSYAPQNRLDYNFSWINERRKFANINNECFIPLGEEYLENLPAYEGDLENISPPMIYSTQSASNVDTISYADFFSHHSSQKEIASYQNTQNSQVKRLLSTDWLYYLLNLSLHSSGENQSMKDLDSMRFHSLNILVRDSALDSIDSMSKIDTTPQIKTFPLALVVSQSHFLDSHSNSESDSDLLKDSQDNTQGVKPSDIVIVATIASKSLPMNLIEDYYKGDEQDWIDRDSLTQMLATKPLMFGDIASLMLYQAQDDGSIDLAKGLDITPLSLDSQNICEEYGYIQKRLWFYTDGTIYIESESKQRGMPLSRITKRYVLDSKDGIVFKDTFTHEDCTKEQACQISLEQMTYMPTCQESCILMPQWDILETNAPAFNPQEKQLYIKRLNLAQSLKSHDVKSQEKIVYEEIKDSIHHVRKVAISPYHTVSLHNQRFIALPENRLERASFIIAYQRDKEVVSFNLLDSHVGSQLNEYFATQRFENLDTQKEINDVLRQKSIQAPCDFCALFLSHSPVESLKESRFDQQNYMSLQSLFIPYDIPFKEVEMDIEEIIFKGEGIFGSDKKINIADNLGKWILYKKGSKPSLVKQDKLNAKEVEKYFEK